MGYPGRIKNITAYQRSLADNQPVVVNRRLTAAEINAGLDLLTVAPNLRYRLVDCSLVAVGGAASGATDVRLTGTQAGATVALLTAVVAGLTQSTLLRAGAANATILANGASFQPCDPGTPIRVSKTGGTLAGATHVDLLATFILE
jgi:hypothetical protein